MNRRVANVVDTLIALSLAAELIITIWFFCIGERP